MKVIAFALLLLLLLDGFLSRGHAENSNQDQLKLVTFATHSNSVIGI